MTGRETAVATTVLVYSTFNSGAGEWGDDNEDFVASSAAKTVSRITTGTSTLWDTMEGILVWTRDERTPVPTGRGEGGFIYHFPVRETTVDENRTVRVGAFSV